ncbi:MAG TPA: hypothetical protein VII32_10050 [Thermoanaerobaculia bacterium]|jgi:hypothetical protein
MKHGHKEKGKKAKAKPSGKKSSPPASKSSQSVQTKKGAAAATAPTGKGGADAKNRGRIAPDGAPFNNPLVASAFKRAVKKFPNAFRRLTD